MIAHIPITDFYFLLKKGGRGGSDHKELILKLALTKLSENEIRF